MIGWKSQRTPKLTQSAEPKGFDDFELRLGDVLRGERATFGKSLLDVQRELRIKAAYIAAIENCDPSAFETPGFIAGYVRSYARYLNMDPDETFAAFCAESGFSTAHGMSDRASVARKADPRAARAIMPAADRFAQPGAPFAPVEESLFSRIEPGAVGSLVVLLALVGGIGYGGMSVLREVQRVQLTPVDQTPVVLSDLDPLQQAGLGEETGPSGAGPEVETSFVAPSSEALDRLYRPQALDIPVLIARDAPISTLDPMAVGVFASVLEPQLPDVDTDSAVALALQELTGVDAPPAVAPKRLALVAERAAFVRVNAADGAVLFEGILDAGDTYEVPNSVVPPVVRIGENNAIYFAVNGVPYGPAPETPPLADAVVLSELALTSRFGRIQTAATPLPVQLALAELAPKLPAIAALPGQPRVLEDGAPGVTILASREAWVRVRSASGATLFETTMQPGDTYDVPLTEQPPTIRTGDAGAIYFAVNGQTFGPFGTSGQVADNLALAEDVVTQQFAVADLTTNAALSRVVAELGGLRPLATD